ncbi:MAG TPA: CrcB family protein [Streptosporangiaceae bacterium]
MYRDRAWWRARAQAAVPASPPSWPSGIRAIPWRVLALISAGGVLGGLTRQGIWALFPHYPGVFDWATLIINVTGCALIGALMTVAGQGRLHRLVPPFLGPGVLGGFTTFSTYIVGIQQQIDAGAPGVAAAYLGGTLVAALAAVHAGRAVTQRILRRVDLARTTRPGPAAERFPAIDTGEQLSDQAWDTAADLEDR